MKLDQATLHRETRTQPATKAFTNGPTAIVRVETVARPDAQLKQLVAGTAEGTGWTLQTASKPLRELTLVHAHTALTAPCDAVDKRPDTLIGVTPGYELQVHAPVMFTVTLKQAGVEKARVTAKAQPGTQRV